MVPPARTAWAASQLPDGARWPLHGPGNPPDEMLVSDEGWLAFAACRLVLQPADLDRAFKRDHHGQPYAVAADECLFSRPKLGDKERLRITQVPNALPGNPGGMAQPALAQLKLPHWVLGGRLRYRKGRWSFAPRQFPGSARAQAKKATDQQQAEVRSHEQSPHRVDEDQPLIDELHRQLAPVLRTKRFMHDPYVDLHRLLHQLEAHHPDEDKPLACHHGCWEADPPARSRCLQLGHLAWGSHADNAYHRVKHGAHKRAHAHRLSNWKPPTSRPGYRQRLRERRAAAA